MTRRRTQPAAASSAAPVPPWPKLHAVLRNDGSGELTINARAEPFTLDDVPAARRHVVELVRRFAQDELGRPVRLVSTDPDGRQWELGVYPDGAVVELRSSAPSPQPPSAQELAPTPPRRRRRPFDSARSLLALGALLLVCLAIALLVTLRASPRAGRHPAIPTSRPPATSPTRPIPRTTQPPPAQAPSHRRSRPATRRLHTHHPRHARRRARAAPRASVPAPSSTPSTTTSPAPTSTPAPAHSTPPPSAPPRRRGQFNF